MSDICKEVPEFRTIVLGNDEITIGPFEGVEKRMIIQFNKEKLSTIFHDRRMLRSISAKSWQSVLDGAACTILSQVDSLDDGHHSNEDNEEKGCTAYLLSESSLFVYQSKIILKTCGTTTPLLSLPILLKLLYKQIDLHNSDMSTAPSYGSSQRLSTPHHDSREESAISATPSEVRSDAESEKSFIVLSPDVFEERVSGDDYTLKAFEAHDVRECLVINDDHDSSELVGTLSGGEEGDDEHEPLEELESDFSSDEDMVVDDDDNASIIRSEESSCPSPPQHHIWPAADREDAAVSSGASTAGDGDYLVDWMLFTHLNYCFPEKQKYPHRSLDEEVGFINNIFDRVGTREKVGSPCMISHFILRTSPGRDFSVCGYRSPCCLSAHSQSPFKVEEMMMLGIDEKCVEAFAGSGDGSLRNNPTDNDNNNNNIATVTDGLCVAAAGDKKVLDEFWFNPCGYSCNALSSSISAMGSTKASGYMTTHISPELESSYASFEWSDFNIAEEDSMIQRCIASFSPDIVHVVSIVITFDDDNTTADIVIGDDDHHINASNKFDCATRCVVDNAGQNSCADDPHFGAANNWFHITHSEYHRRRVVG